MTKLYNCTPYKMQRKKLRREMPKGEIMLWNRLKSKQLGYKFRRQHSIGKYVIDFYCPKFQLGVEVDGLSYKKRFGYNIYRQKFIESLGVTVIQFNSIEIFENCNRVVESIYHVCAELYVGTYSTSPSPSL